MRGVSFLMLLWIVIFNQCLLATPPTVPSHDAPTKSDHSFFLDLPGVIQVETDDDEAFPPPEKHCTPPSSVPTQEAGPLSLRPLPGQFFTGPFVSSQILLLVAPQVLRTSALAPVPCLPPLKQVPTKRVRRAKPAFSPLDPSKLDGFGEHEKQ